MESDIADVREFNRFYTRQIGLLDRHVYDSRFTLPEGRLMYEIAQRGHTTGAELARVLDVDPAYVSRLMRKFVTEELVAITPSATDRRSNAVALTRDGDAAFAELDEGTNVSVSAMLAPLDPLQRRALVSAMQTIRDLLGEPTDTPVVLREHRIGELGWLIYRQGLLYNQQYGWDGDFEALIARIYNEYHYAPESPPKRLWVAERAGQVAGSIFCMPSEGIEGSAQLRMLYVEPAARGLGIGKLLVDQCVAFAREAGYERMRLWTHSIQKAARKLYAAAGFEVVETANHRSFGKDLESEIWELRFRP
jgi:DNA-binding MarR family transcriptional regulator/GNAT superfamily N-acetyltransferase